MRLWHMLLQAAERCPFSWLGCQYYGSGFDVQLHERDAIAAHLALINAKVFAFASLPHIVTALSGPAITPTNVAAPRLSGPDADEVSLRRPGLSQRPVIPKTTLPNVWTPFVAISFTVFHDAATVNMTCPCVITVL